MVDRTIAECINGKWLAQAPSGTQRYASQVMERVAPQKDPALFLGILSALSSPGRVDATLVGDAVSADARSGLDPAGASVGGWIAAAEVVKRVPAYRGLLSQAWQFDDVASAVGMIRELSELQLRRRRIQEQFNFVDEPRKHRPDTVIAVVYRDVLKG